jgi:hypothetical protein
MAKTLKDKLRELEKEVSKNIDPKKFDFILSEVPETIRKRTLLGKGVPSDGAQNTSLDPLSKNYVKFRSKYKQLSGKTTARKSNLTLTGKMLDDIIGRRNGFTFTFSFKEELSRKKAAWVTDGGRRFFDLSKSERNGLQRKISDIIRQEIIKMFNS